jgi:hypothetical protein
VYRLQIAGSYREGERERGREGERARGREGGIASCPSLLDARIRALNNLSISLSLSLFLSLSTSVMDRRGRGNNSFKVHSRMKFVATVRV